MDRDLVVCCLSGEERRGELIPHGYVVEGCETSITSSHMTKRGWML